MTPKNPAAVSLGRKGGQARAKNLTAEQRSAAARKAVEARWAKLEKTVESITEGTKALLKLNRANTKRALRKKKTSVHE